MISFFSGFHLDGKSSRCCCGGRGGGQGTAACEGDMMTQQMRALPIDPQSLLMFVTEHTCSGRLQGHPQPVQLYV